MVISCNPAIIVLSLGQNLLRISWRAFDEETEEFERNCVCLLDKLFGVGYISGASLKDGFVIEPYQEDCLLDISAHVMAMGCALCVNPGFYFSESEKLV